MHQQPPLNDVNALLKQAYRKPINHLLQTSNILLGTVRLLVATAKLTLVFSLLMLLAVHTVSPNTFSPLWTAMINDQRVTPITSIAPHTPPADDTAVMAHSLQALKPANAAPEAAPETGLYAQPVSRPDYTTRSLNSSTRALHTLLTIASLLALLACVLTNEGRFTWVYEDKAYTLYRHTQSLLDHYDMAKLATEHALEKARHADQREGGI